MLPKFQDIVDTHYRNLYHFALSLCKSPDEAWDLTQDTFLTWARKGSSLRSSKAVKSWLYTTLYRDFLKSAKRSHRFVPMDESDELTDAESTHDHPNNIHDQERIIQLLSELKFEYRKVVTLYYLESYSYKEIAKILEIPIGTVMSRLARGKDILKRKLKTDDTDQKVVNFSNKSKKGNTRYG